MQVYIPGEDTFFEVMPLTKGKKVIIYLSKRGDNFNQDCKCFGESTLYRRSLWTRGFGRLLGRS